MKKELAKASLVRAYRTFLQALVSTVPAGGVVTPIMIEKFSIKGFVYVVVAWVASALIAALMAFLMGLGGLPEVTEPND